MQLHWILHFGWQCGTIDMPSHTWPWTLVSMHTAIELWFQSTIPQHLGASVPTNLRSAVNGTSIDSRLSRLTFEVSLSTVRSQDCTSEKTAAVPLKSVHSAHSRQYSQRIQRCVTTVVEKVSFCNLRSHELRTFSSRIMSIIPQIFQSHDALKSVRQPSPTHSPYHSLIRPSVRVITQPFSAKSLYPTS